MSLGLESRFGLRPERSTPVSCLTMYDAAYQGSRGAFSEDAAFKLLTSAARLLPQDTLEDVFNAVTRGEARFGVVPIENTLAGSIHRCYDLLFEHDLKIVGETVCQIVHALIALPGVAFDEIRKALSHPVALAQCELFFRRNPQIQAVSVYDTAGAFSRDTAARATDARGSPELCRRGQPAGGGSLWWSDFSRRYPGSRRELHTILTHHTFCSRRSTTAGDGIQDNDRLRRRQHSRRALSFPPPICRARH